MKKLKIAILAPVEEQVPPRKYGGTERVVYNLIEELINLGHDVTLLAAGKHNTHAKLVQVFPEATRSLPKISDAYVRWTLTLVGVGKMVEYLSMHKFDVVHNHIGYMFLPFAKSLRQPVITTLHGVLTFPHEKEIYERYNDENYVSVSFNQQKTDTSKLKFISNVYNGIETDVFEFVQYPQDYFAYFGSISSQKGVLEAIQIAKLAKITLIMGGKIDPMDETYFKEKIEPLIDGKEIQYIGEVDHEDKIKLLGNAKALIAPIQFEEPFGLYFIESMICGTPVIANNRGSVPEIIVDGKTGYVVNNIEEAVERIKEIEKINRIDCHNHVRDNFSAKKMAIEYLKAYEDVIKDNSTF